jgi:hypothetical protein
VIHDVWRLATDCNKDLTLRTSLTYFRDHFVGAPMHEQWSAPEVEICGRRKRLRDFVSWMLSAPVISPRAKELLEPLLQSHAEMLPLLTLREQQFYALNVTTLVDCLDEARSTIVYSPDEPGRIMNVHAFSFRESAIPDVPVFKIATYPNDVFVRGSFVECVRINGLRGAAFADPQVSPLPLLVQGKSVNVVPGLQD